MMTPPMFLDQRDEWFDAAREALGELIATGRRFDADDLRPMVAPPGNPNWFGVLFGAECAAGRIKASGYKASRSKSRKGGVIRRWKPVSAGKKITP